MWRAEGRRDGGQYLNHLAVLERQRGRLGREGAHSLELVVDRAVVCTRHFTPNIGILTLRFIVSPGFILVTLFGSTSKMVFSPSVLASSGLMKRCHTRRQLELNQHLPGEPGRPF